MILEICVSTADSALAAARGGAHRIELCSNPSEGGTTPSYGLMKIIRKKLKSPIHVLIRPRGGDFVYSGEEFEAMIADIEQAKAEGMEGVVAGVLKMNAEIDQERTTELLQFAHPMQFTFHRAFDLTPDPFKSMEILRSIGVHRILSSGGKSSAAEGADMLKRLAEFPGGKPQIMAGGGIRSNNLEKLVRDSGIKEVHSSASRPFGIHRMNSGGMNVPEHPFLSRQETDEEEVKKMRMITDRLG